MSVRILQSDVSRYSDDVQSTSDSELQSNVSRYSDDVQSTSDSELYYLFESSSDSDDPVSAFSDLSSTYSNDSMQWPRKRSYFFDCDVTYSDMSDDDLEEFLDDF